MMTTELSVRACSADFRDCEAGAVTVDWVVLTAVVVVMFILTAAPVFMAGDDLLKGTADEISVWSTSLFAN